MKTMTILSAFFVFISSTFSQRFQLPVFETTVAQKDIIYGSATNYKGEIEELTLNFYEPENDTMLKRPLLIYVHGGGFKDVNQTKDLVHIVAYCDSLSRRGYATATVNYRLDSAISNRAVVNAMHDVRASVRYFKNNAMVYDIDTSLIFLAGESAGGVTALNVNYIDKESEVAQLTRLPFANDQSVEGNSGSPGYNSRTLTTLAFCAGSKTVLNDQLFEPNFIENENNPSLLMVHGTSDELIPVARSLEVAIRANEVNLPNLYFTLKDAGHCPWFFPLENSWEYLDTLISNTVPFLNAQVQAKITTSIHTENLINQLIVYPNPSSNGLFTLDNKRYSVVSITTVLGEDLIFSKAENNSIDLSNYGSGSYFLKTRDLKSGQSIISKLIIE